MNRRPVQAKIGNDFLKILSSPCEVQKLINFIQEAIKVEVLFFKNVV